MQYRGYLIKPLGTGPRCYTIATEGRGGKIPAVMEGLFTSTGIATQIIDTYLKSKEGNSKSNDKESGQS